MAEKSSAYACYEDYWREHFPDEIDWYDLSVVGDSHYRAVFLHHRQIVEQDGQMPNGDGTINISDLVEWLIESARYCIEALREGTYNAIVARELPAKHRTGTILRRDYWKLYPEEREMCVGALSCRAR